MSSCSQNAVFADGNLSDTAASDAPASATWSKSFVRPEPIDETDAVVDEAVVDAGERERFDFGRARREGNEREGAGDEAELAAAEVGHGGAQIKAHGFLPGCSPTPI